MAAGASPTRRGPGSSATRTRPYPILSVEAANSRELRQILFATRFSREDLLNSFMKQDGQPVLSPWMTSNSAYLERLREATVDLRYIASR